MRRLTDRSVSLVLAALALVGTLGNTGRATAAMLPPPPPLDLAATVHGLQVTFTWQPSPGAQADGYRIEAGTRWGASDLGAADLGNVTQLGPLPAPPGTFYARVHSRRGSTYSNPSNEVVVTVGSSCTGVPGAPRNLDAKASSVAVQLAWQPPASGGTPSSYVLEFGYSAGASNIGTFDVGNRTSIPPTEAPPGSYFARARARNSCGLGPPSSEVRFVLTGVGKAMAWGVGIEPTGFDENCAPVTAHVVVTMAGRTISVSRSPGGPTAWSGFVGSVPAGTNVTVIVDASTGCGNAHSIRNVTWPTGIPGVYVALCSLFGGNNIGLGLSFDLKPPSAAELYDVCFVNNGG